MSPNSHKMTSLSQLAGLVNVQTDSTVSRTVLTAQGARVVLFAFDADQELSEHTAAVPVLLQALEGQLEVGAEGETITLEPGDLIHLTERTPHSVLSRAQSKMALTMLDSRIKPQS